MKLLKQSLVLTLSAVIMLSMAYSETAGVEKLKKEDLKMVNKVSLDKDAYYQSLKPAYVQKQTGSNPNVKNPDFPAGDSRDQVEVYFCTDSYASESSWNIIMPDGNGYYDPSYDAAWIGGGACHSEFLELPNGDYTIVLYDSYGDGGLSAAVYAPGEGTYVEVFGGPFNYDYEISANFTVPFGAGPVPGCTDDTACN